MTNIELYINRQLCDIISPENLGIRLNRILLNPAELSLRDSQYSYSITIPSTPTNDSIFSYANIEEVKNKFNHQHTALLYIDSVKVFEGYFKLSEIDENGNYKGNLVVPAKKTVKEIFGDKKMNEAGEWWLDVDDKEGDNSKLETFPQFISRMNSTDNAKCIFPLVLYGLLPKQPEKQEKDGTSKYTEKTVWDDTVRFGIHDFPPSINCMQAIKHIFSTITDGKGKPVHIGGSAFDDPRLLKLYMSYQNPVDYEQPWNWGTLGKMHLTGKWTNIKNDNKGVYDDNIEPHFFRTNGDFDHVAVNLFNSRNAEITVLEDLGNNIVQYEVEDDEQKKVKQVTNVRVPFSGLYKITLKAAMAMINGEDDNRGSSNTSSDIRFAYSNSSGAHNGFSNIRYELKLLRSRAESSFGMENCVIDGIYFKNNQKQDIENDKQDQTKPSFKKHPMYFPEASSSSVLFVDPAQNPHFVCGFRWGISDSAYCHNPMGKDEGKCSVLAAKSGFSWDVSVDTLNYSAVKSPPYYKYGVIEGDDIAEVVLKTDSEGTVPDPDPEEIQIGYELSKRFKVDLEGADNIVQIRAKPADADPIMNNAQEYADGTVHMVVWLEKGEMLTLADVNDVGIWRQGDGHRGKAAYIKHAVTFDLEIEPFRTDKEWIKVDFNGTGTNSMKWNDEGNMDTDRINLVRFLPSEQKIDEWLDNFCKAFNLQLTQPEPYKFELDVKPVRSDMVSLPAINLDHKAHPAHCSNQPLGLPSAYQIGFKINKDEEGYVKSAPPNTEDYEDGGGSLSTGSIDGQIVSQSSNFSYNWYKEIIHNNQGLMIPIITHKEIWLVDDPKDYAQNQSKLYTHYSQRFWYFDHLYDAGKVWDNGKKKKSGDTIQIALVKNCLENDKILSLDYHDKYGSILKTYFNIIVTNDSNYTYVECYLTPDEYECLNGTQILQFNGDLYYIAAVEGYDPTGRNKTKLKLIRKI